MLKRSLIGAAVFSGLMFGAPAHGAQPPVCDWPAAKRLADAVSVDGQNMRPDFRAKTSCGGKNCPSRVKAVLDSVEAGSKERETLQACRIMLRKYLDRL